MLFQWKFVFQSDEVVTMYPSVVIYSILLGAGWILFTAVFLIFPIRERLSNAKQVGKKY